MVLLYVEKLEEFYVGVEAQTMTYAWLICIVPNWRDPLYGFMLAIQLLGVPPGSYTFN